MADTKFTLRPSFVEIKYHSVLAPHTMRIGTRQWSVVDLGSGKGSYEGWDLSSVDAEDMITALATALAAVYPDTGMIDSYIIWNYPTAEDVAVPVRTGSLAIAGTEATPGQNGAVQLTWTFFDENFKDFKLVMLDAASNNIWVRQTAADAGAQHVAIATEITDVSNAWQSRQNGQPIEWRHLATTLNSHLRQKYGYA